MTAVRQDRSSPERIQLQVQQLNAKLAGSVQDVAYHAGHLGDELKEAARVKAFVAFDQVRHTLSERASQAAQAAQDKKDDLLQRWSGP